MTRSFSLESWNSPEVVVAQALNAADFDPCLATLAVGQEILDTSNQAFVIVEEIQHLTEVAMMRCDETGGLPDSFLNDDLTAEQMTSAANFVDLILVNQHDLEMLNLELKSVCMKIKTLTNAARQLNVVADLHMADQAAQSNSEQE